MVLQAVLDGDGLDEPFFFKRLAFELEDLVLVDRLAENQRRIDYVHDRKLVTGALTLLASNTAFGIFSHWF